MAEVRNRCRLYYQYPAQSSAKLEAHLLQAIENTDAACVLLCADGPVGSEDHLARLVDLVQLQGLACLLDRDVKLAARSGADGVHIAADAATYAEARKQLGETASIGVQCGLSRHDAMLLAELGADYVAFDADSTEAIDAIDRRAELIAWWSEIFVVPCVAWNVENASAAAKLASLGADFVALLPSIWHGDDALKRIIEIDSAVRQARRAA